MDLLALLLLAVGLAVGASLGWLAAALRRSREAVDPGAEDELRRERDQLVFERKMLTGQLTVAAEQRRIVEERATAAEIESVRTSAALEHERTALQQRQDDLTRAQDELTRLFKEISEQSLAASTRALTERIDQAEKLGRAELDKRREAIDHLVKPLAESLTKVEQGLTQTEQRRTEAFATLEQQLRTMAETGSLLKQETEQLKNALRRPEVRGAWGELQLKRVVEFAGMLEHCDFLTQESVDGDSGKLRPDLVVRLAGGRNLVVDAKVSLGAYFDAMNETDPGKRDERLAAHARHVRAHVDALSAKAYWSELQPSPEFVVAFVPGEAMLAQALELDSSLIEHATKRKVMLASPISLILMLRTAAYAWTESDFAENARQVFDEGRVLHKRLGKMGEHLDRLGRSLGGSVRAYNEAIGSLERQVLPSARRMRDLKVTDSEVTAPGAVDEPVRPLSSPELLESAERARFLQAVPASQIDLTDEISLADPDDAAVDAELARPAKPRRAEAGGG